LELEKPKKDVLAENFHQIQMPNINMSKEGILMFRGSFGVSLNGKRRIINPLQKSS